MCDKCPTIYNDDSYLIFATKETDTITFVMKDRGVSLVFFDDDWPEFMKVMETVLRSKLGIEV